MIFCDYVFMGGCPFVKRVDKWALRYSGPIDAMMGETILSGLLGL